MAFINWGSESPEQLKARRAMEEQMMFEQAAFNAATAAAAAGVGSGGRRPGSFQFVVDTTDELEFRLEFTSTNAPIEFTIDWGDGTVHEDSGYGGFYEEFHTYEEAGQYTVIVTFNKPQNVLALDFEGSDDSYANLISITGLQNLRNLQEFRADYNSLVSVDLSGLTNLTWVDISDCDRINSVSSSLTSVNLTGCTGLIELRLDDSDFSEGIPNLTGLSSLEWIDMDQCGLVGSINLSFLASLRGFDLSGNSSMTEVIISSTQALCDGQEINLFGCGLTQQSVDNILVALSTNGVSGGYISLHGGTNASPSATGLAAKGVLEGNGWDVEVN
jgi:Leucine-rich repeat (LRR) protein